MQKFVLSISLMLGLVSTSLAREYGEIMTVHSGDAVDTGVADVACWVRIKSEESGSLTPWLMVKENNENYQPTGCAILLAAYVSNKRIGYDLIETQFMNICFADKYDC